MTANYAIRNATDQTIQTQHFAGNWCKAGCLLAVRQFLGLKMMVYLCEDCIYF